MDILGAISSIFTGGLAGGLTGIIGSISSAIVNYKMKKLEYEHEIAIKKLEMEAKKVEIEVTRAKVEGQISLAEEEALKESYKSANKSYFSSDYFQSLPDWCKPIIAIMFALLDFIRGIIRPTLTIFIISLVTWVGYSTYEVNPQAFVTSASLIVEIILYLAVTVVSWWFSDRSIQKFLLSKLK